MLYWNEGYFLGQRSIRITVSPYRSDINTRDTRVHSAEHERTMDRQRTLEPVATSHGPLQLFTSACLPAFWTFSNLGTTRSLIENRHNSMSPANYATWVASVTRTMPKGLGTLSGCASGNDNSWNSKYWCSTEHNYSEIFLVPKS